MVDFGLTLSPSSRIDLDKFDGIRFEALAAVEPDVRECMACGSCTAVCRAGRFVPASLRAAIEELRNGYPVRALEMLRACQFCGKCAMVCPRGINTRHLILSIVKVYGGQ